MPAFYKKNFTQSLAKAVEANLLADPKEQLQLYDELALMRVAAGDAVQFYAICREAAEAQPENQKLKTVQAEAASMMASALKEVVSVCESAHRIEQAAKDKVSVSQLHFFVSQIAKCVYDVVGDDLDIARKIDERIRTTLKLPDLSTNNGTTLTPDMDAMAMDDTVPKEEE